MLLLLQVLACKEEKLTLSNLHKEEGICWEEVRTTVELKGEPEKSSSGINQELKETRNIPAHPPMSSCPWSQGCVGRATRSLLGYRVRAHCPYGVGPLEPDSRAQTRASKMRLWVHALPSDEAAPSSLSTPPPHREAEIIRSRWGSTGSGVPCIQHGWCPCKKREIQAQRLRHKENTIWHQTQRLEWFVYKPRNTKDDSPPNPECRRSEPSGEQCSADAWIWISSPRDGERINIYCLKPPSWRSFVTVALEHSNAGGPLNKKRPFGSWVTKNPRHNLLHFVLICLTRLP